MGGGGGIGGVGDGPALVDEDDARGCACTGFGGVGSGFDPGKSCGRGERAGRFPSWRGDRGRELGAGTVDGGEDATGTRRDDEDEPALAETDEEEILFALRFRSADGGCSLSKPETELDRTGGCGAAREGSYEGVPDSDARLVGIGGIGFSLSARLGLRFGLRLSAGFPVGLVGPDPNREKKVGPFCAIDRRRRPLQKNCSGTITSDQKTRGGRAEHSSASTLASARTCWSSTRVIN
jgi:hypothetical protein